MDEILFQSIFDELQEGLPEVWKKIVFYASYTEDSYGMKYYVDLGDGEYRDCYSIGNVTNIQLMRLFMNIDKCIAHVRVNLEKEIRWNVMTMIVDSSGSFRTEFDYSDKNEDFISYEKEWKCFYLK
ncbi:MAG TPA: hypothetical protein DCZ91_08055 [Lachnospiraceae bacterium]|nr:hypothetical protein [Lachnospiraceae bacterium]